MFDDDNHQNGSLSQLFALLSCPQTLPSLSSLVVITSHNVSMCRIRKAASKGKLDGARECLYFTGWGLEMRI